MSCWSAFYDEAEFINTEATSKTTKVLPKVAQDVFDHDKKTFKLNSRVIPSAEISTLLKHFTPQELMLAATSASKSDFFMQNNAKRGAKWFYGSVNRVEYYINLNTPVNIEDQSLSTELIQRINARSRRQDNM